MTIRLLTLLMLFSTLAVAQSPTGGRPSGTGSVSGRILDSESGDPLEYSNIVLIRVRDSVMQSGTISDKTGEFILSEVPYGRYQLKVSFIGYDPATINEIRVNPKEPQVRLEDIRLGPTGINLQEVVVSGQRPPIVNKLDKKVVDVAALIPGGNGTAVDVMQQVPSVSVDNEGNISLRGNPNVTILIDGRPSQVEGMSTGDILNSIQVSSIETVEIITNPSARYDPQGTSGIVNIILKHKQESGYQTIVQANAGNEGRFNGSANGNYRWDSWNFYGSFDGRYNPFRSTGTLARETTGNTGTTFLDQSARNRNIMAGQSFRIGTDWTFSETKTLTVSMNQRSFSFDNRSLSENSLSDDDRNLIRSFTRESDAVREMLMFQYAVGLTHRDKNPDNNWNLDLSLRQFGFDRNEIIDQNDLFPVQKLTASQKAFSSNDGTHLRLEGNWSSSVLRTDVVQAGTSVSGRQMKPLNRNFSRITQADDWLQVGPDDVYTYHEWIYAGYSSYNLKWSEWSVLFGLRGEITDFSLRSAGDPVVNQYLNWFPSLHVSRSFSPAHEVLISYSRRIDRPGNRTLLPAVDYADSLNLRSGNPALQPQFINSWEAGYSLNSQWVTATTTVFFRQTTDLISDITSTVSEGVLLTRPVNSGTRENTGIEWSLSGSISPAFRWNGSWTGFRNRIFGVQNGSDAEAFTWMTRLNLFTTLPLNLQLQLSGNYDAPTIEPQREVSESWGVDMSLRREFLDGALAVTGRVNDVFDSRSRTVLTQSPVVRSESFNRWQSRSVFVGLSWRISENYKARQQQRERQQQEMDDF
ncbi:MAG: TonB-dependent receptor [Bacteroidetes bacterium]|nr:TonB-dependent receptor [Bacteroidota bacterium]